MSKRLALLIGNGHFLNPTDFPNLRTPANDAGDLANLLSDLGHFEIFGVHVDAKADAIRESIEEFYNRAQRGDLTLLYYSGHGYKSRDGTLYLIAKNTHKNRLLTTGIEESFIRVALRNSYSRHSIVIFDCCFSGSFIKGKKSGSELLLLEGLKGEASAVLTSSGSIQYSFEEKGRNSLFTHYMLEGLTSGKADEDRDGQIAIDELFDYVDPRVRGRRPEQTPMIDINARAGKMIVAQNQAWIEGILNLPPDLRSAMKNKIVQVRISAVNVLQTMLQDADASRAAASRQALMEMVEDKDLEVARAASSALENFAKRHEERSSMLLDLSVSSQTVEVGKPVGCEVTLYNNGNVDLNNVTLEHRQEQLENPFYLAAGDQYKVTFSIDYFTVGKRIETITARATDQAGGLIKDKATVSFDVIPPKARPSFRESLFKSKTPEELEVVCSINTHEGLSGIHNSDFFAYYEPRGGIPSDWLALCVLCDGAGRDGAVASSLVGQKVVQYCLNSKGDDVTETLENALRIAGNDLHKQRASLGQDGEAKIYASAVAAAIRGTVLTIANVGICRAYLIRNELAAQLTKEHTKEAQLLYEGSISEEAAKLRIGQSEPTRALGNESNFDVDIYQAKIVSGDRLLLCTDGLYRYLSPNAGEIITILEDGPKASSGERLVKFANAQGGEDNITAAALFIQ